MTFFGQYSCSVCLSLCRHLGLWFVRKGLGYTSMDSVFFCFKKKTHYGALCYFVMCTLSEIEKNVQPGFFFLYFHTLYCRLNFCCFLFLPTWWTKRRSQSVSLIYLFSFGVLPVYDDLFSRFGRQIGLISAVVPQVLVSIGAACTKHYATFLVLYFIQGATQVGIMFSSFVWGMLFSYICPFIIHHHCSSIW